MFFRKRNPIENWQDASVHLKVINDHTMQVSFLDVGKIVDTGNLSFKIKNGYISLKRQMKYTFIAGPLLKGIGGIKRYLGLSQKTNLIIIESRSGTGVQLIMPLGSSGGQYDKEYTRIP